MAFLFFCFFYMHAVRLSRPGRICAGVFGKWKGEGPLIDNPHVGNVEFLYERGLLMKRYIISIWSIVGVILAFMGCFLMASFNY